MKHQRENFIIWPKISFKEYEDVEIDDPASRIIYRSILGVINLPENLIGVFKDVFSEHDKKVIN